MTESFLSSERPVHLTGLFCMAVLLVGLTGCAKIKNRTTVVVVDGYWHTPDGAIEFKRTDGKEMWKRFGILKNSSKNYWVAEKSKRGVVFKYGPSFLFGGRSNQIIAIHADQAFYEALKPDESVWGPKLSLALQATREFECSARGKPCLMSLPSPPLTAHPLYGYHIRYHIPYSTDGQDFLIDVTLEFKKDRFIDWSDWHFPGSP